MKLSYERQSTLYKKRVKEKAAGAIAAGKIIAALKGAKNILHGLGKTKKRQFVVIS
ncbi:MAG: hypothetical protein M3209_10440 [Acidobacteriota bacterium]|nr:hypothetical protein [Acidobacteriota bacterium]